MTTRHRPNTALRLDGRLQRTYEAIFRHPSGHALAWHDVRSLLDNLSDMTESDHDSFRATRGGQQVTLHSPRHKDFATAEDVLTVRRFLEQTCEVPPPGGDVLVVIDHHEAKVYRVAPPGAVPPPLRVVTEDPCGHVTPGSERKRYYEAVAVALRGAGRILIFGSGTGESGAMDQLVAGLKRHRDVADRVVGCVVTDAAHRTQGQLLAQAREFFAPAGG
jgi:hypothetical protein